MPGKVIITVERGDFCGIELVFTECNRLIVGSAIDCPLRVSDQAEPFTVSNYHCALEINPPEIALRDFGSKNGTFLNGDRIGQRPDGMSAEEARKLDFPAYAVEDGARIGLSYGERMAELRVRIETPRVCPACDGPLQPKQGFCSECRMKAEQVWREMEQAKVEAGGNFNPYFRRLYGFPKLKDYEFDGEIGEGTYGTVHKARHRPTGDSVAIKFVLPANLETRKAVDQVERELLVWEAVTRRNHPSIIALREYFCIDGIFVMVSEFAPGGSLKDMIYQLGPMPAAEAIRQILPVLDALDCAHSAPLPKNLLKNGEFTTAVGAVHRDIKPDNLVLDACGYLKIADFGVAKAFTLSGFSGITGSRGMNSYVPGTYEFMPRQMLIEDLKKLNPAVDVWAVAATLFFMITGEPPRDFSRYPNSDLVVLHTEARSIQELATRAGNPVPGKIAKVITDALQDSPEIRITTAKELKTRLEEVL